MASAIVAAMLLAWPVGRLCDRFDRYRVLLNAAIIAAGSGVCAALLGAFSPWLLILFAGIYVGIGAALYPIAVAITNDLMDSREITTASTALLLSYGVGSCIGPVASSLVMEALGPRGLFITGSVALAGLIFYMTLGPGRTRSPIPVQEQEAFITTTPEATLGLADMDPRNPDFDPGA